MSDGPGREAPIEADARALSGRGLTFGYGGEPLLRGIDLVAEPGRCVALLGANGAGKTTLLRLLGGFATPDAGRVRVGARDLATMLPSDRVRHVGYLPQRTPRPTGFAVFEIVLMGLYATLPARGWEGFREMRAVTRALRRAGAAPLLRRPFDELSGGEQRRVLLARALVARPEFLLLDEPLAALDPGFVRELTATLTALKSSGVGLVVATHRLSLVRELADHVLVLRGGERIADGDLDSALRPEILDAAYDTDWFSSHAAGGAP